MFLSRPLQHRLERAPGWLVSVYAAICSFCVYFCMYAFRKPFTAASFEGVTFLHINYKLWLVTAQVMGYMLSKFYGIKFISGLQPAKRAGSIVLLILFSWLALLLFAMIPSPYNLICMFFNGFPLGMVWGLVFAYLEGRRTTEFMGAVLCISFIFSSGVVKSMGKYLLLYSHIPESWMPFVTGGLFVLPMLLFTWLLNNTPRPDKKDIEQRSLREPMIAKDRKTFISFFLPGIIIIVLTYVFLTILRDFRDNFANELWTELGFGNQASIFTRSEIPVSLFVLLCMSLLVFVKSNIKAFMLNHLIIICGYLLAMFATVMFVNHHLSGLWWMILIGTGLYTSYVPFNALYFERMIASYGVKGNIGFIMYIADSFGYLGTVMVLFAKEFIGVHLSWTNFFVSAVMIISTLGIIGTIMAAVYFRKKYNALTNQKLVTEYVV